MKDVFRYTMPSDAGKGVVTITYQTTVVSKENAKAAGIYDTQWVNNTFTVNGKDKQTTGDVPFEEKPGPTKTVTPADGDTQIEGNNAGTTGWQPGQILTYTITFGDQSMQMNNRHIYDEMTNLQSLVNDAREEENAVVNVTAKKKVNDAFEDVSFDLTATNGGLAWYESAYSTDNKTVINYTIPDVNNGSNGTVIPGTSDYMPELYGPLTITYKTKVLSQQETEDLGLYGNQSISNSVTINGKTSTTIGDVPFEDQQNHTPKLLKTAYYDENTGVPVFYEESWYTEHRETVGKYATFTPPTGVKAGVDVAGRSVTWTIKVDRDSKDNSTFPLTDVSVEEMVGFSTEQVNDNVDAHSHIFWRDILPIYCLCRFP